MSRSLLPGEQPRFAWKMAALLVAVGGVSTLATWWWGGRFLQDSNRSLISSLVSRYAVEEVRAELYDSVDVVSSKISARKNPRQLHVDAARLEALDEPGVQWLLTLPVFTEYEADGLQIRVSGPTAQWNNQRQEGYFPEAVETVFEQPHQPKAYLHARQVKWNARQKVIETDQPFVLEYGVQRLSAVGLRWELGTGRIELKSQVRWQGSGKV